MDVKISPNKYGADPEFSLYTKENLYIPAHDFFKGSGIIGTDGCSSTGEIRPRPHENVTYVVADIKNILKKTAEHESMNDKILRCGGFQKNPIGGHVHIEIPNKLRKDQDFTSELVHRLDKILFDVITGTIEDETQLKNRQKSGYGVRGNVNSVPWGIEYRPCGSWLVSPEIALIYLGAAKMCYHTMFLDMPVYRNPFKTYLSFVDGWSEYPEDVKMALSLFKDLMSSDKDVDWDADILEKWGVR